MYFNPTPRQFQIRVLIPTARTTHHPFIPSKIWNAPPINSTNAIAPSHDKISNLKYEIPARITAIAQHATPLKILTLRPLASILHCM
jgi:hypothetical protein